jgi:hypothetical protein
MAFFGAAFFVVFPVAMDERKEENKQERKRMPA